MVEDPKESSEDPSSNLEYGNEDYGDMEINTTCELN
jgi:hypothetical protein